MTYSDLQNRAVGALMGLVKSGELPFHAVTGDDLQPPRPGSPIRRAKGASLRPAPCCRHAVNGGGQNQVRAILTGALTGTQTGLDGIPQRFIDGLEEGAELHRLARELAAPLEA